MDPAMGPKKMVHLQGLWCLLVQMQRPAAISRYDYRSLIPNLDAHRHPRLDQGHWQLRT
jgi:hypothetical protein